MKIISYIFIYYIYDVFIIVETNYKFIIKSQAENIIRNISEIKIIVQDISKERIEIVVSNFFILYLIVSSIEAMKLILTNIIPIITIAFVKTFIFIPTSVDEQNAKAHLTNLHYGNNMLKYRRKHRPRP